MRNRWLFLVPLAATVLVGCSDSPTSNTEALTPNLRAKGGGPGYQLVTASPGAGFQSFTPAAINAAHLVIGSLNPSAPAFGGQVPGVWDAASPGTVLPLPVPPGLTLVRLTAVTSNGQVVLGNARTAAGTRVIVRWDQTGTSWSPTVVREYAEAHGIRDDGVVVGAVYRDPQYPNEHPTPVLWDADGAEIALPLPSGGNWNAGLARAVNATGDIAGDVQVWSLGSATISGALWLREGSGYVGPFVLQVGPSAGLSERSVGGELRVIASGIREAWWYRLAVDGSGAWSKGDSVRIGGTATGMNPAGAYAGTLLKGGFSSDGTPYLADGAGAVLRLPMPKGKLGAGTGLSVDNWVIGTVDGAGVLWRP